MTASVNIKRGDLHLMMSGAFNRGRYVLMTGGDGQPQEITIDLRERDDDGFETESRAIPIDDDLFHRLTGLRQSPTITPEGESLVSYMTDDHGPAIPAQGETSWAVQRRPSDGPTNTVEEAVRVYEFALQDALYCRPSATLDDMSMGYVPDAPAAFAADWVHVYDRVTRERRTLKRPAADAVLTGLRDVAADLRRGPVANEIRQSFVEPDAAPLPPVGPLTSTEGLRAGDVLRVVNLCSNGPAEGSLVTVREATSHSIWLSSDGPGRGGWVANRFAFVGRPDASGWMTWAGGENPVPRAVVEVRHRDGAVFKSEAGEGYAEDWFHLGGGGDIVAFRIVDSKGGTTDT